MVYLLKIVEAINSVPVSAEIHPNLALDFIFQLKKSV